MDDADDDVGDSHGLKDIQLLRTSLSPCDVGRRSGKVTGCLL